MFLHLGGSRIVMNDDLIGIFRVELAQERNNHNLLININKDGCLSSSNRYKSFVVTKSSILFSPISSSTLTKRISSSV